MRCGGNRSLARTPCLNKALCLAQELLIVDQRQPPAVTLVKFEGTAACGPAIFLVHITNMDAASFSSFGGKANRVCLPLFRQPTACCMA